MIAPGTPSAPVLSDAGESSIRVTWSVWGLALALCALGAASLCACSLALAPVVFGFRRSDHCVPAGAGARTPLRATLDQVAPISLFKLRLTPSTDNAPVRTVLVPGSVAEAVVDTLAPHTSYVCELAAVNLHGMSDFSAKSSSLTTFRGSNVVKPVALHFTRPGATLDLPVK